MKFATVIRYVGMVMLINAAFMLLSAIVALINGADTSLFPLLLSFIITGIMGIFPMIFVPKEANMLAKESYTIVVVSWILSCLAGMLPYVIWGGEFSFTNGWFESTSGFTTTGATILQDVEALPKGLLFWRASTHWIGGIGVVIFALVILPSVGRTKMSLSNVEISSIAKDNFKYNSKRLFKVILLVYGGLTLLQSILLTLAGMTIFDAVAQSFSTMATGGFSTKNLSVMYWDSVAVEMIILSFMLIAGTHLGLIYATITGRRNNLWRSEVWRYYIVMIGGAIAAVSANLYLTHIYPDFWTALRYGSFQVVSYASTAGFASANDALWPPFSMLIMIFLSIQCAMAGSTSGGLKVDRIMLLGKAIKARILKQQHPNAIIRVKLGGVMQEDKTVDTAVLLLGFYMLTLLISTLVMTLYNQDLLTAFTASVACLGNVGPGFGKVSSMDNMGFLADGAKWWLTFVMLFGRLELFGLIHLFLIRSWK